MSVLDLSERDQLLRQQTTLARFGELALRSEDLDEILTEACRLVGEALGTDLAKVVELQQDGQTLLVRAGVGWKPGVVGQIRLKTAENTPEGRAIRTGEPIISSDIATETRFAYPAFLVENGVRAIANVLIIAGRNRPPFGLLQIDSRDARQFTEDDIAFLRSYANLLAAAVDRLRVINEVRDGNEILEARVAERTRELTEANFKLQTEAAERERVEGALRQSQKMEAVGQLTGGLAHDFNNLLQSISGSLDLMRTRSAQGRTAELGRYIENATASASRAAALTHRLLAFSRRQTLDPKPTDVSRLVAGMEALLRQTMGPSSRVETRFAPQLWPVLCDPHQLEGALLNLVINARDAMPEGGHLLIEIKTEIVADRRAPSGGGSPESPPPGDYIMLAVTDTGAGMTPNEVARAFEPFFTTKPTGQGTGLGLSMVYGFVRQSGGSVRVDSDKGHGTTITIHLPRYLGVADRVAEVEAAVPFNRGKAAILVVEDELAVRMVILDVLSDLGYTLLEAADGRAALLILESGTPVDLLVTDVGLPGGMNGRQLADVARQQRPGLKTLFVTGYAESVAGADGQMEQGMQVMTKPFAMDALVARVEGMISN